MRRGSRRRVAVWGVGLLGALTAVAGTASAAQTELTLAIHWSANQLDLLKQHIAEYEALHPDIKINIESVGTDDVNNYLSKVVAQHAAGAPADILHIYSLWGLQMRNSGVIGAPPADIAKTIAQNFVPAAVKGATVEGQVLGFPTEIDDYLLIYNKAHFAEAGLTVPTTWDALVQDAVKLTKRNGNQVNRYGWAFVSGWDSAVVHPYLALLYGEGGRMFAPGYTKTTLDSPQALAALEKELQLFKEGATSTKAAIWSFGAGNPSMTIMAPWWELSLKTTMKDQFADVGVADIPPGPAGKATVNYTWFWTVDSGSKHQAEAWAFLNWLNSKQEKSGTSRSGDELVAQGIIPSATYDLQNHPQLHDSFMQPFIDAMNYSTPEPNVYRGADIKVALMNQIVKAWSLQLDPKAALLQAAQKIDPILAEYYK